MEEKLKSKTLYKVFLILVKYIPILIAGCYVLNTITCCFGINIPVLGNIAGVSLFTWIFMYMSAVLFQFCFYHKMLLLYVLLADLINIADYYIGIPIDTFYLFVVQFGILGLILFVILYRYVKNNKRVIIKSNRRHR